MGWRRKLLVSTILGFLITFLVFGLIKEFETPCGVMEATVMEGTDSHETICTRKCGASEEIYSHAKSTLIKNTTMWFWPAFLIKTLGKMIKDHNLIRESTALF